MFNSKFHRVRSTLIIVSPIFTSDSSALLAAATHSSEHRRGCTGKVVGGKTRYTIAKSECVKISMVTAIM